MEIYLKQYFSLENSKIWSQLFHIYVWLWKCKSFKILKWIDESDITIVQKNFEQLTSKNFESFNFSHSNKWIQSAFNFYFINNK